MLHVSLFRSLSICLVDPGAKILFLYHLSIGKDDFYIPPHYKHKSKLCRLVFREKSAPDRIKVGPNSLQDFIASLVIRKFHHCGAEIAPSRE